MARIKRKAFNPSGPFVARIAFPFNGTMYLAGERFNEELPFRKLRILYDSRRIEFANDLTTETDEAVNGKDWREMDEATLLAYAFEQTGTRFRKAERAVKALEDVC